MRSGFFKVSASQMCTSAARLRSSEAARVRRAVLVTLSRPRAAAMMVWWLDRLLTVLGCAAALRGAEGPAAPFCCGGGASSSLESSMTCGARVVHSRCGRPPCWWHCCWLCHQMCRLRLARDTGVRGVRSTRRVRARHHVSGRSLRRQGERRAGLAVVSIWNTYAAARGAHLGRRHRKQGRYSRVKTSCGGARD